jgi:hypothetical protein
VGRSWHIKMCPYEIILKNKIEMNLIGVIINYDTQLNLGNRFKKSKPQGVLTYSKDPWGFLR